MMIGSSNGENFRSKLRQIDVLSNIEKMVKNSVKNPELGSKSLAAQILLGLF
jgi:hypothetical protein